jgi:hypothetical protein
VNAATGNNTISINDVAIRNPPSAPWENPSSSMVISGISVCRAAPRVKKIIIVTNATTANRRDRIIRSHGRSPDSLHSRAGAPLSSDTPSFKARCRVSGNRQYAYTVAINAAKPTR